MELISHLFNTLVAEGNVDGLEAFTLLWRNVRPRNARLGLRDVVGVRVLEIFLALSTGSDIFGIVL